jgi:hypothetical protein
MQTLQNRLKLLLKQLKRLPMNVMIRNLVSWEPQTGTEVGYSVAIACMRDLAPVALANIRMCSRLNLNRMHEMILVFDCPRDEIPSGIVEEVREIGSSFDVRLIGYDREQYRFATWISWGWVYSWMSWCLAVRHARTRAVIIHDLDALPLDADFFERRYDDWVEGQSEFCGIRKYVGNGVTEEMGLVTTFELVLDAGYLRRSFRPFDLFNKLRSVNGGVIDFDTTLYVQWRSPRRLVKPIHESHLVHPGQLIAQCTDLLAGRTDLRGRNHMLPMLVYYLYLGDHPAPLFAVGQELDVAGARCFSLFGRKAYVDGVTTQSWAWMEKQIRRVEQACVGATRPEVEQYLQGFIRRADRSRTVGRETGPTAVAAR